jgi:hypothetical protein
VPTKKEKQPLSVTHPELAKEADGWDPSKWTHGARGRFAWLCPIGHQYVTLMSLRTRSGRWTSSNSRALSMNQLDQT